MLAWRWFPHAALFSLALVLRVCWVLWVERTGFPFTDALFYHGHGEVPLIELRAALCDVFG